MFLNRFLITFFTTKMTSCKDALKNWETKTGEVTVEAVAIKLYDELLMILLLERCLLRLLFLQSYNALHVLVVVIVFGDILIFESFFSRLMAKY